MNRKAKLALIAVAALSILGLLSYSASAATFTKSVPGEFQYRTGYSPGGCLSVMFVRWADVPGATKAQAHFRWHGVPGPGKPAETTNTGSDLVAAPFHDRYVDEDPRLAPIAFTVDPGYHWVFARGGKYLGGVATAGSCESEIPYFQRDYLGPVTVELTLKASKACAAADKAADLYDRRVQRLTGKIKTAHGHAKAVLRKQLKRAKHLRKSAQKRVDKICPD